VPGSCCLARPGGKWARVDAALRTGDFTYWIAADRAMRLATYGTVRASAFFNRARGRGF
jgi:hypothetical protein